jgi:TonB-dependent SusC/RagA subfamily outer membrane receptor
MSQSQRALASLVLGLAFVSIVGCSSRQSGIRPNVVATDNASDGYGEQPKGAGASSMTFDEAKLKVSRIEELLEGRFPGVFVQRTSDGGYSVSIRGSSSFMGGEGPLWVIDGVPVEVASGRGLGWINPADVVRIDVLKNPNETGVYGVRGANGVIVVTTKRPR